MALRTGFRRWAVFLVMVGIILTTLIFMILSGQRWYEIGIRISDGPGSNHRAFVLTSDYGHLNFEIESISSSPPPGAVFFRRGTGNGNPYIVDDGISYGVLLAIECGILLFLVPSILSRSPENRDPSLQL